MDFTDFDASLIRGVIEERTGIKDFVLILIDPDSRRTHVASLNSTISLGEMVGFVARAAMRMMTRPPDREICPVAEEKVDPTVN